MTPYEIGLLMHYYVTTEPVTIVPTNTQHFADTHRMFLIADLIRPAEVPCGFELTQRGNLYIEALKMVPLPNSEWVVNFPDPIRERAT